jgi:hypothetical protein
MCGKVTDVRFALSDLSASGLRRRPASASDKIARLALHNVVSATRKQCWIGFGQIRQGTSQFVAVLESGK